MKILKITLASILVALSVLLNAPQALGQAASGIELENVVAFVDFGEQITFVATVKSSLPIQDASILILDQAQGVTHIEPVVLQPDGRTEFRYDTRQNILRPFSQVSWNYRFTLQDGSTLQSDVYSTRYDDNRFDWQSLEADMLRVHWYGKDPAYGQEALKAAQGGLDAVSRMIPVDLTRPVDMYLYANLDDLRGTLVPGSQEWIAGHTDPSLGVVMVAIEPGPNQDVTMQQRIPHELMHVMLSRAAGQGYQNIPTWLSEGTAALAEIIPNMEYDRVLQDALAREDWIPLGYLCGAFPSDSGRAFLAYAESRSFVKYLYETRGSADLLKLINAYSAGVPCEGGPEAALGIPFSKLEQDWQASIAGNKPARSSIQDIVPYLVLLFIILFVPMISIASTMLRKRNAHEPETFIRK